MATQICFIFTPNIGEDEPILTSIFFQLGWFNHQLISPLVPEICSCFTTSLYWTIGQVADCPGSMPLTEEVQQCSLVSWINNYDLVGWSPACVCWTENSGVFTPKWIQFFIGVSIIFTIHFGVHLFLGNTHVFRTRHYINSQRLDRKMENCWSCWVRMPMIDLHKLLCLKKGLVIHIQAKGTPSWSRIEDGGLSTPGYY